MESQKASLTVEMNGSKLNYSYSLRINDLTHTDASGYTLF